VAHAALLSEFVEAVLGGDPDRIARTRDAIGAALGAEALVDAAGAVASFNAVVKVADGSGVVVEDYKIAVIEQMPEKLGQQLLGPARRI
jgi:hypothetical protein